MTVEGFLNCLITIVLWELLKKLAAKVDGIIGRKRVHHCDK